MTHIDDTTSVPRAIETHYNGYRFRSRLEARWAVFLEALDVVYEYEREGFELPSGRYLPDFWLPALASWLEIKPHAELAACARELNEHWAAIDTTANATIAKARDLARTTGHIVVVAFGLPGDECQFAFVPYPNPVGLALLQVLLRKALPDDPGRRRLLFQPQWTHFPDQFRAAYDQARAARFEFGEQG